MNKFVFRDCGECPILEVRSERWEAGRREVGNENFCKHSFRAPFSPVVFGTGLITIVQQSFKGVHYLREM